jgi:AcrR family transcriptional regulator
MAQKSRTERELEARREFIMEAAEELFLSKGFDSTTMDDIAAAAELAKSTLYTVFRSKHELLRAMHLRDARIGFSYLEEAAEHPGNGAEKVLEYCRIFYRFYRSHPNKLLLRSYLDSRRANEDPAESKVAEAAEEHNQREVALLRTLIEEGQADGSIDPTLSVDMTMSHLVYSLHPIAKQSLFSTHRFATFDGDTYFETFAQLIVRGLRAEGEKAS